ncbi:MAG TPA: hypothetical protein DCQ28_10070 [Bacteroidetes bacterium]|nr:hypothetical protein [Bacteroidota bacterium]
MKIDDIKKQRFAIKAPHAKMETTMNNTEDSIDSLIEKLKSEDTKLMHSLKRALPLWGIAAGCSLFVTIVSFISIMGTSADFYAGIYLRVLLMLIFIGLTVAMYLQIKKLGTIDYTEPVILFLRNAVKRYRFISLPYFLFSIVASSILALAASVYFNDVLMRYFDVSDTSVGIIISFAFVALVYVFGYYATKSEWKKSKAAIFEEIKKMQKELLHDSE